MDCQNIVPSSILKHRIISHIGSSHPETVHVLEIMLDIMSPCAADYNLRLTLHHADHQLLMGSGQHRESGRKQENNLNNSPLIVLA